MTYFRALPKDKSVLLEWETATESNNDYFSIEHATDLRSFKEIGQVSGQGTTSVSTRYQFTDYSPINGINYYRLKQIDFDGQYHYSDIVSANIGKDRPELQLWPNPATNQIQLWVNAGSEKTGQIQIYNMLGQLLETHSFKGSEITSLDIPALPSGQYLLRMEIDGISEVKIFYKE